MMKKYLFLLLMLPLFFGCDEYKNQDLFKQTDYFVNELSTNIQSYGLIGGQEYTRYTKDGKYRIMPVGRLIDVRIEAVVSHSKYEDLRRDLEKHYSGDHRVNKVYICEGGTVIIDCRN